MTVMLDKQPEAYQSVFLEDGWAHQRYFGWKVALDHPGLRVLRSAARCSAVILCCSQKGGAVSSQSRQPCSKVEAAIGYNSS